ncbi:MAG: SIR2 family NAD-dependent protein deacylase [Kiritimatiellia bacterium]|jgi:NAD-dependent deacetylase
MFSGERRKTMKSIIKPIQDAKHLAVFTGAGVSTFCGIPDFRGPNGVYRDPDAQRLFDIRLFDDDPNFFYQRANRLVYGMDEVKPGPVHLAVKALQDNLESFRGVITQNVDGLHERAGSSPVYAVHGTAAVHHCRRCNDAKTLDEIRDIRRGCDDTVPRCACGGIYKPDITFFGEALPVEAFAGAEALASRSDLMIVLGTSLTVYPASALPEQTLLHGGKIIIVNAGATPLDSRAMLRFNDLAEFAETILDVFKLKP